MVFGANNQQQKDSVMEITEFMLLAIEVSEKRYAALEIAKQALMQYSASAGHAGRDPAANALKRIRELEIEIGEHG